MVRHTHKLTMEVRKRIFFGLAGVSSLALVTYISGVLLTVHNTVARQNLENEVAILTTHTSEMEFAAIALRNNINLETAYTRGFKEVTHPVFVTRADGPSLTRR
jgi:hypothetical protein